MNNGPRFMVNTHHYKVPVYFEDKAEWQAPDGDTDTTGYFDSKTLTIHVLEEGIAPASQADTLLHEVLHLAANAGGVEPDKKMSEERWVCATTAGWKQILVLDNDELFEWLGVNL